MKVYVINRILQWSIYIRHQEPGVSGIYKFGGLAVSGKRNLSKLIDFISIDFVIVSAL
jgi:hypothetical protein